MRIAYVAKHDQANSNDDEGAIAHALTKLGHDVQRLREGRGQDACKMEADFLLFHGWDDAEALHRVKVPKVFWYFDLVTTLCDSIRGRQERRQDWMRRIIPLVDLGFCTDGDFVAQDKTGKLVCLRQGADERVAGFGRPMGRDIPILMTGSDRGGTKRQSFVDEMFTRWGGEWFVRVHSGVHGRALADLIASSRVVVAPDFPATDRYWSNRAFLTLGFGGFLLHPFCSELAKQYEHEKEIVFYADRRDLHKRIEHALIHDEWRKNILVSALKRTLAEHTYRCRCAELIHVVKERLRT